MSNIFRLVFLAIANAIIIVIFKERSIILLRNNWWLIAMLISLDLYHICDLIEKHIKEKRK